MSSQSRHATNKIGMRCKPSFYFSLWSFVVGSFVVGRWSIVVGHSQFNVNLTIGSKNEIT
jgi:hypothetical protein